MANFELDSESVEVLLKSAHPHVRQYVARLDAINAQLQKRIVEHEADKVSYRNKILALEKQRDELILATEKPRPLVNITFAAPVDSQNPGS